MKALITGASSGIGRDMARILSDMGYDLILVARRKSRLEELKVALPTNVTIIPMDISSTYNCMKLYEKVKDEDIEIVINNAGFGLYGEFSKTKIDTELDMIDLNVETTHTLTKLFLKDFKKKDRGYILNVASSAAFMPGPMMATYYATKAYVLRLTEAIDYELKIDNSNVYVGALCPGPIKTEFEKVANVEFTIKKFESGEVAEYAIKKMFQRKNIIVPGFMMKFSRFVSKILPDTFLAKLAYNSQKRKK
ncbi:MAG: SDR family NAD(P)-dependent oxidoreductase [Bacilli bacterium]|nr:SDR family NAD(P)-dependent oxidoreductase [Bacilli bacterium]